MPCDNRSLLTIAQLARQLNISADMVYKRKAEIGYVRIGRAIRFRPEAVEAYLAARTVTRRPVERQTTTSNPRRLVRLCTLLATY